MALLAEEIVEEWLNRKGYFTIRGIKIGVDEIDILAMKPSEKGKLDCRHIEVQCSMRPVSYISKLPKKIQKETGRHANTVKRSPKELEIGTEEWIEKKFGSKKKQKVLNDLCPNKWSRELVINNVKSHEEVSLIEKQGVKIHNLSDIVKDFKQTTEVIQSASSADLIDLIQL